VLVGLALAAEAQDLAIPGSEPAEAPAAEASVAYQAFPMSEITASASSTAARAAELAALGTDGADFARIRASIVPLTDEVATRREVATAKLAESPSLDLVSDLEGEWTTRARRLTRLLDRVTARASELTLAREELLGLQRRWQATQTQAAANEEPAETVGRIEESVATLVQVRKELRERLNELLAVQDELSTATQAVVSTVQAIREKRAAIRARLLERDHPPIWRSALAEGGGPQAMRPLSNQFESHRERVWSFVESRRTEVLQIAFLAVACLGAALQLRRRARSWRKEEGAERSRLRILAERPISTGLLLALILGLLLIPDAPRVVQHTMGLLMLIPLLRVLRLLMHDDMHGFLWSVAGLYVLDRLRGALVDTPMVERWVLLGEAALAALLAFSLLRSRLSGWFESGWTRWGVQALGLSLLASVAANALGYLVLARLLADGALQTIYAAVAVYAGLEVARSLVHSAFHTGFANKFRAVAAAGPKIEGRILTGLRWLATGAWAWIALDAFALDDTAWAAGRQVFDASVSFGEVTISLGDIVAFVLTVYGAVLLSRVLRFVLGSDIYTRVDLDRGIPNAISSTIHYAILLTGFYLAVAAAGVDLSRLTILIGALGVGIGFGLQNVVNNFVSGLILLYERPVQLGDAVEVGTVTGNIRRIGIRSSTVRTYQGAEVIVPNADLISNQVTNWTLTDRRRRMEVSVGVAYGSDPERVRQILISVAKEHSKVDTDPAPVAIFQGFGDSALNFQLRAWVANMDDWLTTGSELHAAVAAALSEEGIEIPFPQRDLHVRSIDPSAGVGAPPEGKA
jgi:small-conductance mechanosensitive channel